MQNTSENDQGRPHPANRPTEHAGEQRLENAPNLMPDLRGRAEEQGRDPEEVDPVTLDEDELRRLSSDVGTDAL
jgi:hypothetical protein